MRIKDQKNSGGRVKKKKKKKKMGVFSTLLYKTKSIKEFRKEGCRKKWGGVK